MLPHEEWARVVKDWGFGPLKTVSRCPLFVYMLPAAAQWHFRVIRSPPLLELAMSATPNALVHFSPMSLVEWSWNRQ
jgi:hypothetical protein